MAAILVKLLFVGCDYSTQPEEQNHNIITFYYSRNMLKQNSAVC